MPLDRPDEQIGGGVPTTCVPARNLVLLSLATSYAEVVGADDVYLGITAADYSGYPDCRPEFLEAFSRVANRATRATTEEGRTLRFHAPLIALGTGTRAGTWSTPRCCPRPRGSAGRGAPLLLQSRTAHRRAA